MTNRHFGQLPIEAHEKRSNVLFSICPNRHLFGFDRLIESVRANNRYSSAILSQP